jgi:glycosyltransferase involved in cell wall biosynthesis
MKKLSIVVPCYNEAENLPKLLAAYDAAIIRDDIEVILVNNGSTDETAAVLTTLSRRYERFLHVVTIEKNQGYGFGIYTGLKAASAPFLGWTHGDLQTPPADVIRALAIIEENHNNPLLYVKGTRVGRPLFDRFFSWGMSVFETLYFGVPLHEINAQPNIFHRSFFETFSNPPDDFSFDLYVLCLAHRYNRTMIRFRVPFLKRQHGVSKWNTGIKSKWKFIKRTISFSVNLKMQFRGTHTK